MHNCTTCKQTNDTPEFCICTDCWKSLTVKQTRFVDVDSIAMFDKHGNIIGHLHDVGVRLFPGDTLSVTYKLSVT